MSAPVDRARELAARAGLREVPGRILPAVLALAVGLVLWAATRSSSGADVQYPLESAPAVSETMPASVEATFVVVHVAGCVRRPGVYSLPAGSRVGAAVDAAGGALGPAELDALNLARVLRDGEQVLVPRQGEPPSAAAGESGIAGGGTGLVDLNTAGAAELEALPGIGPATAEKIVKDREANGPFASPEDLMRVPGIGPKKFDALKDMVTAG